MSWKSRVRIKVHDGVVEFVGEIDNTTATLMGIHEKAKNMGIVYEIEKDGMSLMATTFCG